MAVALVCTLVAIATPNFVQSSRECSYGPCRRIGIFNFYDSGIHEQLNTHELGEIVIGRSEFCDKCIRTCVTKQTLASLAFLGAACAGVFLVASRTISFVVTVALAAALQLTVVVLYTNEAIGQSCVLTQGYSLSWGFYLYTVGLVALIAAGAVASGTKGYYTKVPLL